MTSTLTYKERARIPAVVIHKREEIRNVFDHIVSEQSLLRPRGSYTNAEGYLNSLHGDEGNQHLILTEPTGLLEIAEPLKNLGQSAKIILLDRSAEVFPDSATRIANDAQLFYNRRNPDKFIHIHKEGILSDHDKDIYKTEFEKAFNALRENRELWVPRRVGFVGGGQSTNAILDQIRKEPWLESAWVYSERSERKKKKSVPFINLYKNTVGGRKIKRADLDELLAAQPDILWITAGVHRKNFNIPRDIVNAQDLLPGWKKIAPALERIAEASKGDSPYKPLVVITTNPVEPYLVLAHRAFGIRKDRLTSLSSDGTRAQDYAWEKLVESNAKLESLKREDVQIDIWGRHGAGAVAVWNTYVPKEDKNHFHPLYYLLDQDQQQDIGSVTRSAGRYIRDLAEKTGINYRDFPEAAAEGLRDIAQLQQKPKFSWCIGVPDHALREILRSEDWKEYQDPFLFLPTTLQHTPLSIGLDKFSIESIPSTLQKHVHEELGRLVREQYHDVYTIAGEEKYKLR